MRFVSAVVVSLLFLAFAAPQVSMAASKKSAAKSEKPAGGVIQGTIVGGDTAAKTIIIQGKTKTDTIMVDDSVAVTRAGKKISLAEIERDSPVSATFRYSYGVRIITKINQLPAGSAKRSSKSK
jgi:hypothetical protein